MKETIKTLLSLTLFTVSTIPKTSLSQLVVTKDSITNKTGIQSVIILDSGITAKSLYNATKKLAQLQPQLFSTGEANQYAAAIDEFIPRHTSNAMVHAALYRNDKPLTFYDDEKQQLVAKMMIRHEGKSSTMLRRAFVELNLNFSFKQGKCRFRTKEIIIHIVNAYDGTIEPKDYTWDELKKENLPKKSMEWLSGNIVNGLEKFISNYKKEVVKLIVPYATDTDW
ncbi:MAG: hypothetical protein KIS94_05545 [Chitinophagales bacterium]|nr:hypothetical protein [Chitinophagales bacterium]